MSEEQQQPKTNNELTERVNNAYIANNYTLLNGGTDNVIMISGDKDDKSVDVLLTLDGMEEVVQTLRKEVGAIKNPEDKADGHEE